MNLTKEVIEYISLWVSYPLWTLYIWGHFCFHIERYSANKRRHRSSRECTKRSWNFKSKLLKWWVASDYYNCCLRGYDTSLVRCNGKKKKQDSITAARPTKFLYQTANFKTSERCECGIEMKSKRNLFCSEGRKSWTKSFY